MCELCVGANPSNICQTACHVSGCGQGAGWLCREHVCVMAPAGRGACSTYWPAKRVMVQVPSAASKEQRGNKWHWGIMSLSYGVRVPLDLGWSLPILLVQEDA